MRLKDVCNLLNGRAYKQQELLETGRYPVLRVGNLFSNPKWYYSDLELDPEKYCDNGDLLYAWSASFGPKIWDGGKVIFHYHIWRTQPDDRSVLKEFLYRWFDWDKENIKREHGTGSTMIHVTKRDMEERILFLPPLAEQRRIVAKLDALAVRLARARAELARAQALVIHLRSTALFRVFDNTQHSRVEIRDVTTDIRYGTAKKCDYNLGKTPVLRIPNVVSGAVELSDLKTGKFDQKEISKLALIPGDILVIRSNGSVSLVGRSAVVQESARGMLYAGYLIRIRVKPEMCLPDYLQFFLQSKTARQAIEIAARSTSGVHNVNAEQLRSLILPLPDIGAQKTIVSQVEEAFARADRLKVDVVRAQALINRLEGAILAKAFRGELVSPYPAD